MHIQISTANLLASFQSHFKGKLLEIIAFFSQYSLDSSCQQLSKYISNDMSWCESPSQRKPIKSRIILKPTLLPIIFAFSCLAANAEEMSLGKCYPNMIVETKETGVLSISEFALTYLEQSCPSKSLKVEKPITLKVGQKLHIWLRLQGDIEYLSNPNAALRLDLVFYRDQTFEKAVSVGRIDVRKAKKEATKNHGKFDWRTRAWRGSLTIPGTYYAQILQGQNEYCLIDQIGRGCGIRFEVVE